jgi:CheY-like chemotaxis protein
MPLPQRILIIDDSPADAYLLQIAFSQLNPRAEVVHFEAGEAALTYLAAESTMPDLLMLDFHMTPMSGLEVFAALSERGFSGFPVYIYSGSVEKKDAEMALEAGVDLFLSKQNDFDSLLQLLQSVL